MQPIPFGRYLLLEGLSTSARAETFKAKLRGLGGFEKMVVLKRVAGQAVKDARAVALLLEEARVAGQLSHAKIRQVLELGAFQGIHFISMEYVSGKDLSQMLDAARKFKSNLPCAMAAFLAAEICEGLDYAHRKPEGGGMGVVHGHLEPSSVLVSFEGEVKLIDFGVTLDRDPRTQRQQDLVDLGLILYQLLSGKPWPPHGDGMALLESSIIPQPLIRIVGRLITRRKDGYGRASDVHRDLQLFLVSQTPMFGSKQLSDWMRLTFSKDLSREQLLLRTSSNVSGDPTIPFESGSRDPLEITTELPGYSPSPTDFDSASTLLDGSLAARSAQRAASPRPKRPTPAPTPLEDPNPTQPMRTRFRMRPWWLLGIGLAAALAWMIGRRDREANGASTLVVATLSPAAEATISGPQGTSHAKITRAQPAVLTHLVPGAYQVEVITPGLGPYRQTVELDPDSPKVVMAP